MRDGCYTSFYAEFSYGTKKNSSLAEFKGRKGFEEMRFPSNQHGAVPALDTHALDTEGIRCDYWMSGSDCDKPV